MPFQKGNKLGKHFKKGQTPWNKGIPHTDETKENISKSLKGRVLDDEWKKKLGLVNKGRKRSKETGEKISKALKGKIFSIEHRQNISKSRKGKYTGENNHFYGKTHTEETIQKISKANTGKEGKKGEKSHFWKGGITPINKLTRSSKEYKEWRRQVYERDDYTCQYCRKKGGKLQADHIKPFALFEELRFEVSNGRTLCEECHKKTDTYGWKCIHNKKLLEPSAW